MQLEMILLVIIRFIIIKRVCSRIRKYSGRIKSPVSDYCFCIDTIPGLIGFSFPPKASFEGRFAHISPLQEIRFQIRTRSIYPSDFKADNRPANSK
jgi:hypothetical protein